MSNSLYGDMTPHVGQIMKHFPKDAGALEVWAYFGKFLFDFFEDWSKEFDQKVVDKMVEEINSQNHSGGSIGVITQELFLYLSGRMTDKQREVVKDCRK